jgi:hypothetical protein
MIALGLAAFVLLVAIGVVWLYFQARFRFVMLEGVRTGEPRIRGVFGDTRRAGAHYFLFLLALSAAVLLLLAPLIIPWIPVLERALQGHTDSFSDLWVLVILTALWLVPVLFAAAVLQWWVYDLVLPLVWVGKVDFRSGLGRAWALTRARLDAVLALLLMRVLVGIAGLCAGCALACISCVAWIWPALVIVGAAVAAVAFPLLWVLAAPLILVVALVVAWIVATVTAPIPLLYRSWSWAFVHALDPSLPLWEGRGEGGAQAP